MNGKEQDVLILPSRSNLNLKGAVARSKSSLGIRVKQTLLFRLTSDVDRLLRSKNDRHAVSRGNACTGLSSSNGHARAEMFRGDRRSLADTLQPFDVKVAR